MYNLSQLNRNIHTTVQPYPLTQTLTPTLCLVYIVKELPPTGKVKRGLHVNLGSQIFYKLKILNFQASKNHAMRLDPGKYAGKRQPTM